MHTFVILFVMRARLAASLYIRVNKCGSKIIRSKAYEIDREEAGLSSDGDISSRYSYVRRRLSSQ